MTAPLRQKKHDRLRFPTSTDAEVKADFALGPFDRAMRDAEAVWGIDRLPELVSAATAEKWASAMAKLNDAIAASDAEAVAARGAVCVRGIAAMDAEARAAGHAPVPPEAWPIEVNGKPGFLIRDAALWPVLAKAHPGVAIWTMGEVALALECGPVVQAAKEAFAGAQITAVRKPTPTEDALNDFIPF